MAGFLDIEQLAQLHPNANDPYEPFCGVAALFNGDSSAREFDRAEWEVISPHEIRYLKPHLHLVEVDESQTGDDDATLSEELE